MKNNANSGADEIVLTDELVQEALDLAALDAIESHRRSGLPLVVGRHGKIEYISAEEALAEMATTKRHKPRGTKRRQSG